MTSLAVCAASGQLGRAVITALIAKGQTPIALARSPEKAKDLGVEIRPGDYNDPAALEHALQGVERLLLISGMDAPEKRIGQHRNVIHAAQKNGVQKIVYTSIQGAGTGNAFSPIVQSNRQTEQDVRESGLHWVIGRNGLYIEPDFEALDGYKAAGRILNCAGDGPCGYTTRPDLAAAYANLLCDDRHYGQVYNLHGESLTQAQLAAHFNRAFGTDLSYQEESFEAFCQRSIASHGSFLGTVIAGIYQGIQQGAFHNESHYAQAAGRSPQSWEAYFAAQAAAYARAISY